MSVTVPRIRGSASTREAGGRARDRCWVAAIDLGDGRKSGMALGLASGRDDVLASRPADLAQEWADCFGELARVVVVRRMRARRGRDLDA
jgi:hypothetical protein